MTAARTFLQTNGAQLKIDGGAIAQMLLHVQSRPELPESGGVLIGRHLLEMEHIVVDQVTAPLKEDCAWRFGFFRSRRGHQSRLDSEWATSGQKVTYLGEWHTHPEDDPTPSSTDLKDWKRHLVDDVYDGGRLFFIIVGMHDLRVWEGQRRRCKLTRLEEFLPNPTP